MERPIIVAEIGINHNGDLKLAKNLIALASNYGADYVKFQKKTPELCVPDHKKEEIVDTPWGYPMKYIDYKKKMEFSKEDFREIDLYCKRIGIEWFVSVWDEVSVDFLKDFKVPFIKVPSACITNKFLLHKIKNINIPTIISTGMSDTKIVDECVDILGDNLKYILHTTSSYPTPNSEMNMSCINTLKDRYKQKIGFSNHCADLIYIVQSYIMGAEMIEFHFTLDRRMAGTDQWASIGPTGFDKIMKHINNVYVGWGDGALKIEKSEISIMNKLRK